jgi:hypothetical protein
LRLLPTLGLTCTDWLVLVALGLTILDGYLPTLLFGTRLFGLVLSARDLRMTRIRRVPPLLHRTATACRQRRSRVLLVPLLLHRVLVT